MKSLGRKYKKPGGLSDATRLTRRETVPAVWNNVACFDLISPSCQRGNHIWARKDWSLAGASGSCFSEDAAAWLSREGVAQGIANRMHHLSRAGSQATLGRGGRRWNRCWCRCLFQSWWRRDRADVAGNRLIILLLTGSCICLTGLAAGNRGHAAAGHCHSNTDRRHRQHGSLKIDHDSRLTELKVLRRWRAYQVPVSQTAFHGESGEYPIDRTAAHDLNTQLLPICSRIPTPFRRFRVRTLRLATGLNLLCLNCVAGKSDRSCHATRSASTCRSGQRVRLGKMFLAIQHARHQQADDRHNRSPHSSIRPVHQMNPLDRQHQCQQGPPGNVS